MTEKTKTSVILSVASYSIIIAFLIALGVNHDEDLDKATSTISLASDGTHFVKYLAILMVVYCVRALVLLAPLWLRNRKWESITTFGIGFCILPEVFVLTSALGLVLADGSNCPGPGPFSNCGMGFLIVIPIIASIIFQLLGMLIGSVVALFRK